MLFNFNKREIPLILFIIISVGYFSKYNLDDICIRSTTKDFEVDITTMHIMSSGVQKIPFLFSTQINSEALRYFYANKVDYPKVQ